jgi:hypothetical protein
MFILRRISSEGIQMNQTIGESYTYIGRFENAEEFRRCFKKYFERDHVADLDDTSDDDTKQVYCFISNGSLHQPLYMRQQNYIMTDSGKTFSNLSWRG